MQKQGAAAAAPAAMIAAAAVAAACGCPLATKGSLAWGALHCWAVASARVSLHSANARLRPCACRAADPAAIRAHRQALPMQHGQALPLMERSSRIMGDGTSFGKFWMYTVEWSEDTCHWARHAMRAMRCCAKIWLGGGCGGVYTGDRGLHVLVKKGGLQ